MKARKLYEEAKLTGMFGEWYPELTWDWKKDRLKWLEMQGVISETSTMSEKLQAIHDNETEEEIQDEWNSSIDTDSVGCSVEEYIDASAWDTSFIFSGPSFDTASQIIYEALHNPEIHDSGYSTISLHKTREGAEQAIINHKIRVKKEFDDLYNNPEYPVDMVVKMKWDDNQNWYIRETELLD